jgi:antitoxin (DNA-binding transcriptional repressor) of toxin-antitoxin stability system
MKSITLTELNHNVSRVTREVVESGEPVQVTNRGTAILRLVPESTRPKSRLEELYELGMATPPRKPVVAMSGRPPVVLSRPVEQILDDVNGDADVEFTR